MRPGDVALAEQLLDTLRACEAERHAMPGLRTEARWSAFVEQLVDSVRRVRFRQRLLEAEVSVSRTDPESDLFDPLRAAVVLMRNDEVDEAFWMIFLFVHFGRSVRGGYRYAAEVYGRRGSGSRWGWDAVSGAPGEFREWMDANADAIAAGRGGFGNHRKYESLSDSGRVVANYVDWVGPSRSHRDRLPLDATLSSSSRRDLFSALYDSMEQIYRFGRVARFDYLATVSHLGLASIEPDRAYLAGATGPLTGAKLLLGASKTPVQLEADLAVLDTHLSVGFDVLEDAICNWQKSPDEFRPFRG